MEWPVSTRSLEKQLSVIYPGAGERRRITECKSLSLSELQFFVLKMQTVLSTAKSEN